MEQFILEMGRGFAFNGQTILHADRKPTVQGGFGILPLYFEMLCVD